MSRYRHALFLLATFCMTWLLLETQSGILVSVRGEEAEVEADAVHGGNVDEKCKIMDRELQKERFVKVALEEKMVELHEQLDAERRRYAESVTAMETNSNYLKVKSELLQSRIADILGLDESEEAEAVVAEKQLQFDEAFKEIFVDQLRRNGDNTAANGQSTSGELPPASLLNKAQYLTGVLKYYLDEVAKQSEAIQLLNWQINSMNASVAKLDDEKQALAAAAQQAREETASWWQSHLDQVRSSLEAELEDAKLSVEEVQEMAAEQIKAIEMDAAMQIAQNMEEIKQLQAEKYAATLSADSPSSTTSSSVAAQNNNVAKAGGSYHSYLLSFHGVRDSYTILIHLGYTVASIIKYAIPDILITNSRILWLKWSHVFLVAFEKFSNLHFVVSVRHFAATAFSQLSSVFYISDGTAIKIKATFVAIFGVLSYLVMFFKHQISLTIAIIFEKLIHDHPQIEILLPINPNQRFQLFAFLVTLGTLTAVVAYHSCLYVLLFFTKLIRSVFGAFVKKGRKTTNSQENNSLKNSADKTRNVGNLNCQARHVEQLGPHVSSESYIPHSNVPFQSALFYPDYSNKNSRPLNRRYGSPST